MFTFIYKHSSKLILISLVLSLLFGCQSKPPLSDNEILIDKPVLLDISKQNEMVRSAVQKLESGKILDAEILINQVLQVNKSHPIAILLKKQLSTPSNIIFNTARLTQYTINPGDTLGKIAKDWLGNSIYFVSLAKLNHIDTPSRIQPGMLINIPVIDASPLVKEEKIRSRANLELLKKYTAQKQFTKSLQQMTNIFILDDDYSQLLTLQKDTLELLAQSKVSISERHKMIDKVALISAASKRKILIKNFQEFSQQQQRAVLYDEFKLLFEADSYDKAANKLIAAKEITISGKNISEKNIGDVDHQSSYSDTVKSLINKLHERAIILRKNQKLQKAADSWGTILKIQPNNNLALKYYHRTIRLIERLNEL